MREVAEFYMTQQVVIDVKYVKRTHRQESFNAVKEGKTPYRLIRQIGKSHIHTIHSTRKRWSARKTGKSWTWKIL